MDSDIHSKTMPVSQYGEQYSSNVTENEVHLPAEEPKVDGPESHGTRKQELPTTFAGFFALLMGLERALTLVFPGVIGAILAWSVSGEFSILEFILSVTSLLCLIIGINIFSQYSDYRFGLRPESKYFDEEATNPGINLIATGVFQTSFVISSAVLFVATGFLLTLLLTFTLTDWPSLFFFTITGLLLTLYLVPPSWHGYLEWGLGEVGILLGVGIAQVAGTYYAQREMVDALPLLFGIPMGLFSVLILFSRNLISQRRDWMIRKRTLAVALGEQRSVYLLITLVVLVYASLMLVVILSSLPLLLLLGLATLPLAIGIFKQPEDILQTAEDRHYLHQRMIRVMAYSSLLLAALLIANKFW